MESTPFLRPQMFMHALVPLSWAFAFRVVRWRASSAAYAALALWMISVLAAGGPHHIPGGGGAALRPLGAGENRRSSPTAHRDVRRDLWMAHFAIRPPMEGRVRNEPWLQRALRLALAGR
jgi:hypothetical protein